ncbi:hypothetical protein ACW5WN_03330 [Aeromonas lacus]
MEMIFKFINIKDMFSLIILALGFFFGVSFDKPELIVSYMDYSVSYPDEIRNACKIEPVKICSNIRRTDLRVIEIENMTNKPIENFSLRVNGVKEYYGIHTTSSSIKSATNEIKPLINEGVIDLRNLNAIPSNLNIIVEIYGEFYSFNMLKGVSVSADANKIDLQEKESVSGVSLFAAENYHILLFLLAMSVFMVITCVRKK